MLVIDFEKLGRCGDAKRVQAPKSQPPAAKQAKILQWFHESMGVYSFKELEKLLPSVGSINGMQVKDYLQALVDENQIRVEKIGSGNWYWSFTSDAVKSKESMIASLSSEETQLKTTIAELERQMEREVAKRTEEEEVHDGKQSDRKALLVASDTIQKEIEALDRDLTSYSDTDPTEVLRRMEETQKLRDVSTKWTDNIEAIQSFLMCMADRDDVAGIMQRVCGDEYVPGEGLKEL